VWEYQNEEVVESCRRWLVLPLSPLVAGGRACVLESNQLRYFRMEDGDPDEPLLAAVDAATGQPVGRLGAAGQFRAVGRTTGPGGRRVLGAQAEPLAGAAAPSSGQRAAALSSPWTRQPASGRSQIVLSAPAVAPPLVAGAWLYLLTADHTIQVVDPGTGRLHRWLAIAEDRAPIQTPHHRLPAGRRERLARGPTRRRTDARHHGVTVIGADLPGQK
jgi:hypothetical protein